MSRHANSSNASDGLSDRIEAAAPDPREDYADPETLRDDERLDLAVRERILQQWKLDLDRLIESESEGMSAQDPISVRREGKLAEEERQVTKALNFIKDKRRIT